MELMNLQLFAKKPEEAAPTQMEAQPEDLSMLLDFLAKRYDLQADAQGKVDPRHILEAMEAEGNKKATAPMEAEGRKIPTAPVEENSLEARIAKLEQSYAERIRREEKRRQENRARAIYEKWQAQAEQVRELYPSFVLEKEMEDPRFAELLRCGVDVRTAFEVIHKDEILSASMHYAACEVEKRLSNKLIAGSYRPSENGGTHAPSVSKVDVSRMTAKERKDIVRRVRMGETIRF